MWPGSALRRCEPHEGNVEKGSVTSQQLRPLTKELRLAFPHNAEAAICRLPVGPTLQLKELIKITKTLVVNFEVVLRIDHPADSNRCLLEG